MIKIVVTITSNFLREKGRRILLIDHIKWRNCPYYQLENDTTSQKKKKKKQK